MKKVASTFFGLLVFVGAACGASINCSKPSSEIDKVICENAELIDADKKLSNYYSKIVRNHVPEIFEEMRVEQFAWLKQRIVRCPTINSSCLLMQYEHRTAELQAKFGRLIPIAPLSIDELSAYDELSGEIKKNYINPVSDKEIFNACLGGMVSRIDTDSSYLDANATFELIGQKYGEVGLELAPMEDYPMVVAPIDDGPAYDAGVRNGDRVIKIDGYSVKGMPLEQVVKRLRGDPETKVGITLKRKGEYQPIFLTLIRARGKIKSVKFKLLEPGIAYVRITQFREKTAMELTNAVSSLIEQNREELKGFILDLRNNPGGLLKSAVAVSAVFLGRDELVLYTEGRAADAKMKLTTLPYNLQMQNMKEDAFNKIPPFVKTIPLVILVNNGSAAASEIIAGAMQDYKRATIIGVPTFGNSTIQTIFSLPENTAVKLTTAHWFTPKGRSVKPDGILPDVVVDDSSDLSGGIVIIKDTQLERALTLLKMPLELKHELKNAASH